MNRTDVEKLQKDPRLPPLGSTLSNCRLSSIIGIGGVAVIYQAFEPDLEMQRAIKVLKPDAIDFLRKKFETEAKVMARLDHPNIVKVHGSGIYDGRLPFIHMEFIDGKNLRAHLSAHHTLPFAVGISIVAIIASTLEYAYSCSFSVWGNHSDKLVHRDIKPENILIAKDGTLKIMDFGLAQFEDDRKQGGWGTPAYMSPEQLDHQKADLRNDLYSLGVILYEMLCGVRPFPDDEAKSEQLKKEGNYQPIHTHAPSVPESICEIVDKCLKSNIDERYRTYESLRTFAMKALGEITSRSPHEIVKAFFTNPDDFHLIQHAIKTSDKQSNKSSKKHVFISTFFILIVTLIITILIFKPFTKSPVTDTAIAINTINNGNDTAKGPPAPDTIQPIVPEKTNPITPVQKPRIQAAEPSHIVKRQFQESEPLVEVQKPIPPSMLLETIQLWKNGNFSAVIANINEMQLDTLSKPLKDSAIVLLADSYYASRSIPEIIELGSRYDINEARYYVILAFANEIFQNFTAASGYIDKAIIAPIRFGSQTRSTLLYERAMLYKRHFDATKDEPSKKSMLEAFRRFITEGCTTNSTNCQEAKTIVKPYE